MNDQAPAAPNEPEAPPVVEPRKPDYLTAEGARLGEKFMKGDLTNALVQEIKLLPVAWSMMTEAMQDEVIDRLHARVDYAIDQCVQIIAADGRATIVGTLDKLTIKDGIQAQVSINKDDPLRHELIDSQGATVLVVVAGSEKFKGGSKPKADPDQPELLGDADKPGDGLGSSGPDSGDGPEPGPAPD